VTRLSFMRQLGGQPPPAIDFFETISWGDFGRRLSAASACVAALALVCCGFITLVTRRHTYRELPPCRPPTALLARLRQVHSGAETQSETISDTSGRAQV
jgi:hypothetical protein